MKAAPVFEAGNHRWWVLYDQDERRVIDSNVYIVESDGQSAVLDPGGFEIFPQVLAAVAEVVPPTSVAKAFVSHQDPDIASSLPLWNACNDHIVACAKSVGRLPPALWSVECGVHRHSR
jgi:flavorubredoxin